MTVDFKCIKEECKEYNKVHERNVLYSEIEEQTCLECKEKLERVWTFNGGIKTNDGYK